MLTVELLSVYLLHRRGMSMVCVAGPARTIAWSVLVKVVFAGLSPTLMDV
jgi:hypothetical protein